LKYNSYTYGFHSAELLLVAPLAKGKTHKSGKPVLLY